MKGTRDSFERRMRTSTRSKALSLLIFLDASKFEIAKCLYCYRDDLITKLGQNDYPR